MSSGTGVWPRLKISGLPGPHHTVGFAVRVSFESLFPDSWLLLFWLFMGFWLRGGQHITSQITQQTPTPTQAIGFFPLITQPVPRP